MRHCNFSTERSGGNAARASTDGEVADIVEDGRGREVAGDVCCLERLNFARHAVVEFKLNALGFSAFGNHLETDDGRLRAAAARRDSHRTRRSVTRDESALD